MARASASLPDLASRPLGGGVVARQRRVLRRADNLVDAGARRRSTPRTFGAKGQVYDGWETRRRRERRATTTAIVRLGAPGVVRGVVVDTAFFTGNYPPRRVGRGLPASTATRRPAELADARLGRRWCRARRCTGDTPQPVPGRRRPRRSPTCG